MYFLSMEKKLLINLRLRRLPVFKFLKHVMASYLFICTPVQYAYSGKTAHPFQKNGAPFRLKLSKAQLVN